MAQKEEHNLLCTGTGNFNGTGNLDVHFVQAGKTRGFCLKILKTCFERECTSNAGRSFKIE